MQQSTNMTRFLFQILTISQLRYPMYMKKICLLLLLAWAFFAQQAHAQNPCNGTPPLVEIDPPALSTCQNPTVQLNATITPSAGNYTIDWFGGVSNNGILNPIASGPGTYALFVYDSLTGCWAGDTVIVLTDGSIPYVNIVVNNGSCGAAPELMASADGNGPFEYAWSDGQTTQTITGISSPQGTYEYCVTVTNTASGCSEENCAVVVQPAALAAEIFYFDTPFCNDSLGMWVTVTGGSAPYTYSWNNGNTTPFIPDPSAGTYVVTVTDAQGCSIEVAQVIEDNPDECANLEGYVLADWNTNCTKEGTDQGWGGLAVKISNAAGDEFYAYTDVNGFYRVEMYPGTYDVTVIPANNLWDPCVSTVNLTLNSNQTLTQDFLLQPLAICPAMSVDLGTPFLRRCFSGQYSVFYCNHGTADATNATVEILLDPFLTVTSAQIPYTDLGNNQYRFELGDVPFNTCGYFWFKVQVSCDATLGQTHCTEAVIYPTGDCLPANPQWSGASLKLGVTCTADSVDFTIENIGTGPTTAPLDYVVIEDAVMLMQAPPPTIYLANGATHHVKVPANGSTWRLEVAQEAFHPGNSLPSAWAEGCANGAQFSTGFVNQFPADDNDPWVDIDCTPNVGSYDPNDKQGFPTGYAAQHFIRQNTDVEYLIRFQNTGTDTAFTVVIRDQLSPWFDPGTVRPGASSHPYVFEYYGDRDIKFTFNDIQLPDSSANLEGSQGFVSFKISQKKDVPLQTNIENTAGIYFDFNAPVYTNTTVHRVGQNFVTLSNWQPFRNGLDLRIMPNPVEQTAILDLQGVDGLSEWQVEMLDATGRSVRTASVHGSQWQFERGHLPAGLYLLQVRTAGQLIGTGKVMLR